MKPEHEKEIRALCQQHGIDPDRALKSGDVIEAISFINDTLAIRQNMFGLRIYSGATGSLVRS